MEKETDEAIMKQMLTTPSKYQLCVINISKIAYPHAIWLTSFVVACALMASHSCIFGSE